MSINAAQHEEAILRDAHEHRNFADIMTVSARALLKLRKAIR